MEGKIPIFKKKNVMMCAFAIVHFHEKNTLKLLTRKKKKIMFNFKVELNLIPKT